MRGLNPSEAPRRKLRLVSGVLKALLLVGALPWVLPAQAQTVPSSSPASMAPLPRHSQNTSLLGGVWWFGTRQGTR